MDEDSRLRNRLAALAVALTDEIGEAAELAAGTSGAAPAALVALHESAAGESLDRLRLMVGLTPSGAVRLVDRLVDLGLVERRPGRDARSVGLALTRSGRRVARGILAARAQAAGSAVVGLDRRDRAELLRLTDAVLGQLTRRRLDRRRSGGEPPGGALCRLCDFGACGRHRGECPVARAAAGQAPDRPPDQPPDQPSSKRR